ncbi:MAG TPA: helix-turn-helix domain-containing protein [Alphaproteobacteria bacterium]|nr:helix-turn-helix domain-containing protein [Alphaproteobacteria bacterium]
MNFHPLPLPTPTLPAIAADFQTHLRTQVSPDVFEHHLKGLQLESIDTRNVPTFSVAHQGLKRLVEKRYMPHIIAAWQQQFAGVATCHITQRLPVFRRTQPVPLPAFLPPPPAAPEKTVQAMPAPPPKAERLPGPLRFTSARVCTAVAEVYGIAEELLQSHSRASNVVFPRQVGMYVCKLGKSGSAAQIGKAFGRRDHTTVLHGCKQVEKKRHLQQVSQQIDQVLALLQT